MQQGSLNIKPRKALGIPQIIEPPIEIFRELSIQDLFHLDRRIYPFLSSEWLLNLAQETKLISPLFRNKEFDILAQNNTHVQFKNVKFNKLIYPIKTAHYCLFDHTTDEKITSFFAKHSLLKQKFYLTTNVLFSLDILFKHNKYWKINLFPYNHNNNFNLVKGDDHLVEALIHTWIYYAKELKLDLQFNPVF